MTTLAEAIRSLTPEQRAEYEAAPWRLLWRSNDPDRPCYTCGKPPSGSFPDGSPKYDHQHPAPLTGTLPLDPRPFPKREDRRPSRLRPDTAEGRALRNAGMDRAAAGSPGWGEKAMAHVRGLPQGTRLTSEDITAAVGMPPGPKAVGALVAAASRAGLINPVGVTEAERPERHAGLNRVWERTDAS